MKLLRSSGGAQTVVILSIIVMFAVPKVLSEFGVMQATLFAAVAIFGLSQGFVWGYAGIMSFGQAAFFGLGSYTYAIAVMNMGDSTVPFLLAILATVSALTVVGRNDLGVTADGIALHKHEPPRGSHAR